MADAAMAPPSGRSPKATVSLDTAVKRPTMKASLEFLDLADYPITVPLWVAMYAAPLQPFKSLNAGLWVYGSTQSGKSTLSHVALSHFGSQFTFDQDYRSNNLSQRTRKRQYWVIEDGRWKIAYEAPVKGARLILPESFPGKS